VPVLSVFPVRFESPVTVRLFKSADPSNDPEKDPEYPDTASDAKVFPVYW